MQLLALGCSCACKRLSPFPRSTLGGCRRAQGRAQLPMRTYRTIASGGWKASKARPAVFPVLNQLPHGRVVSEWVAQLVANARAVRGCVGRTRKWHGRRGQWGVSFSDTAALSQGHEVV